MCFINKKKWFSILYMMVCIVCVITGCGKNQETSSDETAFQESFVDATEEVTMETVVEESLDESLEDAVEYVPVTEVCTTEAPITEEVVVQESIAEESATEGPTTEAFVPEAPTTAEETNEEEPAEEEPTVEETTTEAPVVVSVQAKVKGSHYMGDTLSAADFVITVVMSDGSTYKNPSGWGADPLYLGSNENIITVTYQGMTTEVVLHAQERPAETVPVEEETESGNRQDVQPEQTEGNTSSAMELRRDAAEEAFRIQNDLIVQNGGTPLAWSETYYRQACDRAREIVTNFSHDGFYSTTAYAENIAKGSYDANVMVQAWYNSDGHRNNMLHGWNYGAIACYGSYWVALFGPIEG